MPLLCLTLEVFLETGVARGGCFVYPCGLAAANAFLESGLRVLSLDRACRGRVAGPGAAGIDLVVQAVCTDERLGIREPPSSFQKADAVQIAGIANSSIGGKATEPHK